MHSQILQIGPQEPSVTSYSRFEIINEKVVVFCGDRACSEQGSCGQSEQGNCYIEKVEWLDGVEDEGRVKLFGNDVW